MLSRLVHVTPFDEHHRTPVHRCPTSQGITELVALPIPLLVVGRVPIE